MKTGKQALIYSIGSFVLMFAQWLISVLLVRLGSFEDAGVFSLAMSISGVFIGFADYGIRKYQISDLKGHFTQEQYILTRTVLLILTFIVCAVYLSFSSYSAVEFGAILIYYMYSFSLFWGDVLMGAIQMKGRLEINGYSNFIKGVACFAAFMISFAVKKDILLSLTFMAATMALLTVTYDISRFKKIVTFAKPKKADVKALFSICRVCFPLMVALVLPNAVSAYPRRVINLTLGNESLGYFASLFAPTSVITIMVPTLFMGFIPQIAVSWSQNDKKRFAGIVVRCYGIIILFTAFVELCSLMVGKPLIRLVFGEEIMPYFDLFYLAVLTAGLNTLTICGRSILAGVQRNMAEMIMSGIELMLTVALSGVLIRSMGIFGGAIAMCVGYGVHALIQMGYIWLIAHRHFSENQILNDNKGEV